MKISIAFALLTLSFSSFSQTADWRFSFEYDEYEPPFWGISEASHDTLLTHLAAVTSAQSVRGGINVNWGSWAQFQPNEGDPIQFNLSDDWVKRFQKHGFELVYNLTSTAEWAFENNPTCINVSGQVIECAPDEDHWDDWYDFVRAVVERYNGDGEDDMPGLEIPVRFYVMDQEVYFVGDGQGDDGEAAGKGFWEDNIFNLVRLHKVAYQAVKDADPSGYVKLVGSGGLLFDLYGDFPDYPAVEGPTVQARLDGDNLFNSTYTMGWDSLTHLLSRLGDDSDGVKCDYIGWHPHMGWKASDQCMKLIQTYAPGKPIFIDDNWTAMLLGVFPFNQPGYTQFIGGDSLEGDFPTPAITSYNALLTGLTNENQAVTDWYNAKTARETVKCFATLFGEGVERAAISMTNDLNETHPLFGLAYPWRYSGLLKSVQKNYAPKPAAYTLQLLIEKLHDFTSVEQVYSNVVNDPHTRVYKFHRQRGTDAFIAWSETGWNTTTPEIPNGTTVQIPVISSSLDLTHIVTEPGETEPEVEQITPNGGMVNIQLGFEPVIIEETVSTAAKEATTEGYFHLFPNPAGDFVFVKNVEGEYSSAVFSLFDVFGKKVLQAVPEDMKITLGNLPAGVYFYKIEKVGKELQRGKIVRQNP